MKKVALSSKYIAIVLSLSLILFIFFSNNPPITISKTYANNKQNLSMTPPNRIIKSDHSLQQIYDLVYFNTKMPFDFDQAKVKLIFKNEMHNQKILLGYKDEAIWHYDSQVFENPLLDSLRWNRSGNGPYLYQKTPVYNSVADFFSNPPKNKIVGVVDYKDSAYLQPNISIPNYAPLKDSTSINTPIRGKIIMYAYLNNEPFSVNVTKQDLNWYADPDVTDISVYKQSDKVFQTQINDDGNVGNNHNVGDVQTAEVKNPGPGLPEPGVYKIVINSSNDSLITNITTNLHKIVFEGPINVADNAQTYGSIVKKTKPTNLITGAQNINFRSDHLQPTSVMMDQQLIKIDQVDQVVAVANSSPTVNISIPTSDIVVNGSGYFAFSSNQYFAPTPYKILPINSSADIAQADYILTDYPGAPKKVGDWYISERKFDLSNAVIRKGQLSWLINVPSLKDSTHDLKYRQIEVTLTKKGWFKQ
jgi:hypothetical protein